MKTAFAPRASAILYDILRSRPDRQPFLLPANICPIVPITFLKAGTPFEFVDISPDSLSMDLDLVEGLLKASAGRHAGILYAHTYGDPTTPSEFFRWAKDRWPGLVIVDDRCLCVPDLEPPESLADATLYSTGYAKIVDAGFGGLAFLQDEFQYQHHGLAFNAVELQDLEAAYKRSVGRGSRFEYRDSDWLQTESALPAWSEHVERIRQLLPATLAHRREINAVYNSLIPAELQLKPAFQLWRFNLQLADKDAVLGQIFEADLFASSHYRSLVGIMGEGTGSYASRLHMHVVNLFNDLHYTVEMAERTARIIVGSL
jgi:hypothetical protein